MLGWQEEGPVVKQKLLIAAMFMLAVQTCAGQPARAEVDVHHSGLPVNLPSALTVLKNLKVVAVRATATEDAKKALKSIGQSSGSIESSIVSTAKDRLQDIGLTIDADSASDLGKGHAELLFTIFTDLQSGTVKLNLELNELVSIVRSPETKVSVTTWQQTANPRSNEAGPMAATGAELLERFIGDYIEANPRGKHK
jgi:hypothetical protein